MKKKYQVFISSTYEDLKDERMAVMQCLLDNDCIPVGMEQFPASGMSQMEYIEKMLDDCDYYILILAGRYGSLDDDGIGFTEKEFDYANSRKPEHLPVLSFVAKDIGKLPSEKCERLSKNRKKLEDFRKKVCSDRLVKFYTDIGSLKSEVVTSINKCIKDYPAVGWVRGDNIPSPEDFDARIEAYLEKHEMSRETIAALWREVQSKPNIYYGTEFPKDLKDGDFFIRLEDER